MNSADGKQSDGPKAAIGQSSQPGGSDAVAAATIRKKAVESQGTEVAPKGGAGDRPSEKFPIGAKKIRQSIGGAVADGNGADFGSEQREAPSEDGGGEESVAVGALGPGRPAAKTGGTKSIAPIFPTSDGKAGQPPVATRGKLGRSSGLGGRRASVRRLSI
jgi:hypothetical protein